MYWMRIWIILAVISCSPLPSVLAQKEHGFDNTKSSGQPYLPPEESLKRLQVPPGWEVKLFAAEPDIINPIAFSIDERGRLWVVECYEYPSKTPKGKKPRDRIKILEDTTGSGHADKVTVWAEGKDLPIGWDLATGLEVGHGGVFLGAAPYLFFLQDTKGTGRCDRQEILLSGFGSQDTHETLNTFQWGPDGFLYGLHGIFTQSKVGDVRLNAAMWRYQPDEKKFGIYADGTSNPWGLDFDSHGQAFLTACVIPHAFHMIPGGTYIRQDRKQEGLLHPYAYGQIKEICDHTHHKESGWAHAGALVLQGDNIPREYQGSLLMGSIHGCSIKRDILERNGSTFVAHHGPDFLVSGDKNFRPINLRWGPDGSIYVIDWHDQNPCHQAKPDSWDMTHGRIYKIQPVGTKSTPPGNLADKSSKELVDLLKNNNPWWHRTALRLLTERRDRLVAPQLQELVLKSKEETVSLRGLWGLYAVGALDEDFAEKASRHASPWVRSWTVRLLGESNVVSDRFLARMMAMAAEEKDPEVRLQLACTAQRLTGQDVLPLLHNLMSHKEDAGDPCLPLMIWLAYEPRVVSREHANLDWLRDHASGNPLVSEQILPRTIRRLVATGRADDLSAGVVLLGDLKESDSRRHALEGFLEALKNRQVDPPAPWKQVLAGLLQDGDKGVRDLGLRLAIHFHDVEALRRSLAIARDGSRSAGDRVEAIRDLSLAPFPEAMKPLLELVASDQPLEVRSEACRALGSYDNPEVAKALLTGWKQYPPALRQEAVNVLARQKEWAHQLLDAVGRNQVARTDLTNNTILTIRGFHDSKLDAQIEAVWGRVRDTPAELNALIDQMRQSLGEGRASPERGRKVFENTCAKCHKFESVGHEVGPNLDGAARDIEYLLVNVLDPNRVVGLPYYTRFITLKNGKIESGLLAGEDDQTVTLKGENDALKVILRKDIDEMIVEPKSVMPEGLTKGMTVQDFRDLVRYVMANPFLTEVAVAGPLAESVKLDPAHPLAGSGMTWSRPVVGPPGRIPLPPAKGNEKAVAYVSAQVTAPDPMRTRLQLGTGFPVQAWINGKLVYDSQPGPNPAIPDQVGVDLDLTRGVNQLLFRITYRGEKEAFSARLLDPQRRLHYPEADK